MKYHHHHHHPKHHLLSGTNIIATTQLFWMASLVYHHSLNDKDSYLPRIRITLPMIPTGTRRLPNSTISSILNQRTNCWPISAGKLLCLGVHSAFKQLTPGDVLDRKNGYKTVHPVQELHYHCPGIVRKKTSMNNSLVLTHGLRIMCSWLTFMKSIYNLDSMKQTHDKREWFSKSDWILYGWGFCLMNHGKMTKK